MHELGIAEGILDVVLGLGGGRSVRRVAVRVGVLQRIAPESLEFSLGLLAEGTAAAAAALQVTTVPAMIHCLTCGARTESAEATLLCSQCGSSEVAVTGGDIVEVEEVELDGDPPTILRRPAPHVRESQPAHRHDTGVEAQARRH